MKHQIDPHGLATLDVATLEPKLASSNRVDPYRLRASEIFGVAPDQVTATQRNYAKVTLYHEIYGITLRNQS